MSRVTAPALRGTWLGHLLRVLNPVMRRLLASPLHWPLSRYFMLLTWTGRRTGRRYTTPVSYVREGERLFVTTGDRWWRGLVGGDRVEVRIAGRRRTALAMPVTDPEACIAEHERLLTKRPFFRRLAGLPASDGVVDRRAVEQSVAAGRVLVQVDLHPERH